MVKGIITTQFKHEILKQQIQRPDPVLKTLISNFNDSEDKIDDT